MAPGKEVLVVSYLRRDVRFAAVAPVIRRSPMSPTERLLIAKDAAYDIGQVAEVVEGYSTTISCSASGTPSPSLQWRLPSGRRLKPGQSYDRVSVSDDGRLRVANTRLDDSGKYRCIASNPAGRDRVKTELRVIRKFVVASSCVEQKT